MKIAMTKNHIWPHLGSAHHQVTNDLAASVGKKLLDVFPGKEQMAGQADAVHLTHILHITGHTHTLCSHVPEGVKAD